MPSWAYSRQRKPTTVLIAMRITDVGVAVFSVRRKRSVKHAKEQMSMPEPEIEEKMPPRKPVANKTAAFQLNATYEPKPVLESSQSVQDCASQEKEDEAHSLRIPRKGCG